MNKKFCGANVVIIFYLTNISMLFLDKSGWFAG